MAEPSSPVVIVSPRRALIALIVVCVLFTAMGAVILALAPTKPLNLIVGTLAVGFFGVGGGISIVSQWRRSVVLKADDDGIRLGGGGTIPWADVDRVGATSTGLGVRLRRYDTLLRTAPRSAGHTAQSLRESRTRNAGWDLTWAAKLLDRPAGEAARDIQRRRPHER